MPHSGSEEDMAKTWTNWKTVNYPIAGCDFGTFGQHQTSQIQINFTHNQTNTKLNLNSIKNTTIPTTIQA